jgi:hypothetical protein
MAYEELFGLTLLETKIEGIDLHLLTKERGWAVFEAWADCCGKPWVESINESAVLPAKILDWERKSHRVEEDGYMQVDYDFYTLKTDKGFVDVDMRTRHNGYYSGRLIWQGFLPLTNPEPIDFG